jgi:hypothetical protein
MMQKVTPATDRPTILQMGDSSVAAGNNRGKWTATASISAAEPPAAEGAEQEVETAVAQSMGV